MTKNIQLDLDEIEFSTKEWKPAPGTILAVGTGWVRIGSSLCSPHRNQLTGSWGNVVSFPSQEADELKSENSEWQKPNIIECPEWPIREKETVEALVQW